MGASLTSVTVHAPFSSLMVVEILSAISCPPMASFAWYLYVPGFRSTAGLGAPTLAGSTFFVSTTVFGSTVISARRLVASGVPPSW